MVNVVDDISINPNLFIGGDDFVERQMDRTNMLVDLSKGSNTDSDIEAKVTAPKTAEKGKVSEGQGTGPKTSSSLTSTQQKSLALAGLTIARAGSSALQAIATYNAVEERGRRNIALANFQFREAIAIGKRAALREETKGFARGEEAVAKAVAQGQSATGGIADSAQRAEETYGILNASLIESNAIAQAYGFQQQAILTQHEIEIARISRDAQLTSSALAGAAAITGAGLNFI